MIAAMRWMAFLAALTGCGSAAHRARPPSRTPYLMLFEQGKAFTLPATQTTSAGGAPVHGTATCTVAEVKQVGDATVSRLACAAPYQSLLISGTWVAAPAGLYHPYLPIDDPDELNLLGEDDLLIAKIPKERSHRRVEGMTTHEIEAFDFGTSWCVEQGTLVAGSSRNFALCFDGTSVTGASDLVYTGPDWQRVEVGRAPSDDEGPYDHEIDDAGGSD